MLKEFWCACLATLCLGASAVAAPILGPGSLEIDAGYSGTFAGAPAVLAAEIRIDFSSVLSPSGALLDWVPGAAVSVPGVPGPVRAAGALSVSVGGVTRSFGLVGQLPGDGNWYSFLEFAAPSSAGAAWTSTRDARLGLVEQVAGALVAVGYLDLTGGAALTYSEAGGVVALPGSFLALQATSDTSIRGSWYLQAPAVGSVSPAAVPEPSALGVVALAALAARRRRGRSARGDARGGDPA